MKQITFSVIRNLFILIGVIASRELIQAQTLFGTTSSGGVNTGGVVFTYDISSHQYKLTQQFASYPGTVPLGSLIQASDGNLYGMTSRGGSGNGTIFKIDLSGTYTMLAGFTVAANAGYQPLGSLVQAYDGNLYGTTSQGGVYGNGTLFKYNITTDSIIPLVSFNSSKIGSQAGTLLMGSDSNLYGVAMQYGTGGEGAIFKYSIKKDTLEALYSFTGNAQPNLNLIFGLDGNLYGTTLGGGSLGYGSIFRCTLAGALTTLASFNITNGRGPLGVIEAADSSFYGMTNSGGSAGDGTIFKYKASTGITTLVTFTGPNGNSPYGKLIQGNDGNLYGMTASGGTGEGCIFKCSTSGVYTLLVNFNGPNGDYPNGSLLQASDGNLYGMTEGGGPSNTGVLFRCTTSGSISPLFNFGSSTEGSVPMSGLSQASDGNLYGTTSDGGYSNGGTIYKLTLTDSLTTLLSFSDTSGKGPLAGVIQASDGNFYGTTNSGGITGNGTIYRYNPLTHILDTLVNLGTTNGTSIYGKLIEATDGNLYGVTYQIGSTGYGALFRITLSGQYKVLVTFPGGSLSYPFGSLIQASDGNLYGTTQGVNPTYGAIFKYIIGADSVIDLFDFNGVNGADAQSGVIQGIDGNLYGTTFDGGASGYGTIFKCSLTGTFTTLVNFTGANGEMPHGGLVQASDSNLYGTTSGGNGTNYGNLFKCTTSGVITNLVTFTGTNGSYPQYVDLLEVDGVKINITTPACTSQTLTAVPQWSGKSPYVYSWSTGATTSSISGITTGGSYLVTVTDSNGVAYTGRVNLPAYSPMRQNVRSVNILCYGTNSGAIIDSVTGGSIPYSFLWNNGKTTSSINNISAGTYSVSINDKYGCIVDTSINIAQPLTGLSVSISATNVKCNGLSDGSASVTVSGGVSPYTYLWNTGATSSSITGLPIGNYSITVTDSNKCYVNKYDTVHQPASTLDSVRICMVTVDTGSLHNIIVWNKTGLNNIDSFKVYFLNSASVWQLIGSLPFSSTQFIDTTSINNPNANTVRYVVMGVDSCGYEEPISSSPWQNTMYINNSPPGTFIWSGTGYLIQNVSLPVLTYYLYRDSIGNGNWQAIDSVSGTQNKMTDPKYANYVNGRWYVGAKLNVSGCPNPVGRAEAGGYTISRSNVLYKNVQGVVQLNNSDAITAYPNPASKLLNIQFSGTEHSVIRTSIMDVTGRVVMESDNDKISDNILTINISKLTAGIYFMRIETNNSIRVVKFSKE
ncbi:MAG TPA: choice-of-anchor tandem repeat GloVer-containing protein [Bacteroidia bacterium]|nr:choice-of-anchor tandem repeat GloVer-containing protein [Bacteroidia bacterium]